MLHLSPETIARLVEETPDAQEALHLSVCTVCARELAALQQQTSALSTLADLRPARSSWPLLEERLEREHLIALPVQGRAQRSQVFLRLAASIAIFAIGAVSGASLRSAPVSQPDAIVTTPGVQTIAAAETSNTPVTAAAEPVIRLDPAPETGEAVVATGIRPSAASIEGRLDPATDVQRAEAAYLRALARFTDTAPGTTTDPVARLAALESILMTTKAALQEAPADPVINGYHLTAIAQRDAVLRQMAIQPDPAAIAANSARDGSRNDGA